MLLQEGVTRNIDGATVIKAKIGPAVKRAGFEKKALLRGIEVGLFGWQRSHSQGPGTGHESIHGIVYAPECVNNGLQNLGIERFIRELLVKTPPGVELWLITDQQQRILFEASIEVDDQVTNPKFKTEATPFSLSF